MSTRVEAVVQAAGSQTRYACCGRGSPAVIVATTDEDRLRLAALLVGEHRVFEPVPPVVAADPAGSDALAAWLLGVIEGLGLCAPHVLLAPSFAPHAPTIVAALGAVDATITVAGEQQEH